VDNTAAPGFPDPSDEAFNFGYWASGIGDINGDGYDDFQVGIDKTPPGTDASSQNLTYVFFGKAGDADDWGEVTALGGAPRLMFDLNNFAPTDGFIIKTDASYGPAIKRAGDINGDGFDDLIVGSTTPNAASSFFGQNTIASGEAYVIFGKPDGGLLGGAWGVPVDHGDYGIYQEFDINSLTPSDGFIIQGYLGGKVTNAGYSVSGAGDINNDGLDDVIVGAPTGGTPAFGEAYVVFGKQNDDFGVPVTTGGSTAQVLNVASLTPTEGFIIRGDTLSDYLGAAVSSAGDVNNDSYDDLIIINRAGQVYVVFGKANGWGEQEIIGGVTQQVLDLANFASSDGFIIQQGNNGQGIYGPTVISAGDLNGDGFSDILISGSPIGSVENNSYVVWGKAGGWGEIDVNTGRQFVDFKHLMPGDGFLVDSYLIGGGMARDFTISIGGDINQDGYDDLIVGGYESDVWAAYIIFGRADFGHGYSGGIGRIGTANADWLVGSDVSDSLNGGSGGSDVLLGYAGDDMLAVANAGFKRIDGGDGFDTLLISGSGVTLDFTTLPAGTVTDIEQIDINGIGDNTFQLALQDVLDMSSTTDTLIVRGGVGDTVLLAAGFNSAASATQQIIDSVTFNVYSATDGVDVATLLVEQNVAVALA
jgi:hypothetical protein